MNSMFGSTGMAPRSTTTGAMKPFKEKIPKGYGVSRLQQFDPQQMQLYESLFGQLGPESYLSRLAGGDEEIFREIEHPAMRQFGELLGGIGSRFSAGGGGAGALGARRSSGFQHATTSAAQDFASQLASQRQNLQRQAYLDLMQGSQMLLGQRPYETMLYEKEEKPSFMQQWGGPIGAGVGALGGLFFGNPIAGAQLGYGIGSSFGGGGGGNSFQGNFGSFGNFRNPFSSGGSLSGASGRVL